MRTFTWDIGGLICFFWEREISDTPHSGYRGRRHWRLAHGSIGDSRYAFPRGPWRYCVPRHASDELRRENEKCNGAPRFFTYPAPLPISDEDRQRYDEITAKLPKTKRRARRRR